MAEAKQELKARKSSGNKTSIPSTKPKSSAGGKATKKAGRKARPGKEKEAGGDGAVLLQEAANQAVINMSVQIADGLARRAEQGDTASTKMLVELMAGKMRAAKKSPEVRRLLERLERDKQWVEPREGEGTENRD